MKHARPLPTDPEAWIEQTFDVPAVRNGGIFRTSMRAVEAGPGIARLKEELDRRNFRALRNNGHIVIFCNTDPVEIIATGPRKA